jgi:peptidyl-prolyl cis-trans isomerase A (cyclophilin A)
MHPHPNRAPIRTPPKSRRLRTTIGVAVLLGVAGCGGQDAPEIDPALIPLLRPSQLTESAPDQFTVRFETTAGSFDVGIARNWAPLGADRFYNLVRAGYYTDVYVHRVIEGYIAGFGIHDDPRVNGVWNRELMVDEPRIMRNERGRVAFAQSGPNTRSSELFINLADNSNLDDAGYVPIGEVVRGMEVVDSLYAGYGDGPPRGEGPYGPMAESRGNVYFEDEFPLLDRILSASVIAPGGSTPDTGSGSGS